TGTRVHGQGGGAGQFVLRRDPNKIQARPVRMPVPAAILAAVHLRRAAAPAASAASVTGRMTMGEVT
ncbi:hypothetical protein, partial [Streptomyces sp. NPDC127574]|uniref:hypothetical protein n=1 Tax=Streptomyces sp. NPDC127574 TaxID=3345401 RepID=UPI00363E27D9